MASAIGAGLINKGDFIFIFLSVSFLLFCDKLTNKADFFYTGIPMYYVIIGILDPDKCWVSTHTDRMHSFWQQLGTHPTLNNCEVLDNCDVVFLAIKPHMLDNVIISMAVKQSEKKKYKGKLFISVLAGVTLDILHNVKKAEFYTK